MKGIVKTTIAVILILCAVSARSYGQNNTGSVNGIVTDQGGASLPGATVEASANGKRVNIAISDSAGNFAFKNLPAGSYTFNVHMVGYDTRSFTGYKIMPGHNAALSFVLSSSVSELSSVVVIGYGTRKRQDVTGAVAKADLLIQKQSPNANVMSSLRGTVPGLTVGQVTRAGSDPTLMVRGRNSISGTTSPLIVVDGLIYRGALTSINPSDIASIDLLKDASAAAVYGSQASNGVVLITTKSGASGIEKLTVDYSGSYSIQEMTKKSMRPASGAQYIEKLGDWYLSESRDPNDMTKMNPNWDPTTKMPGIEGDNYKNGDEANWWKLMTNSRPRIQNHNISLSGRSKKIRFYLGYGYFDQLNLIMNDNYRRNSV
ncbi:MAG TPA: carboxypeptidase regulatory-like domain-containing protein, partial [Chitinophaga sp.]|uniref:carboxypeptidase regulatory-like domain-containing protein n=1 Tax=Chitinophaga sp. TaxID=1869181 RepID=UPI002F94F324